MQAQSSSSPRLKAGVSERSEFDEMEGRTMSETAKADWRTLEAGAALDRIVAERLGWRIELRPSEQPDEAFGTHEWIVIRGGDEDTWDIVGWINDIPDIDAAWEQAFRTYEGCDSRLPLYSRDANAALALLDGVDFEIYSHPKPYRAIVIASDKHRQHSFSEYADTPALAIVRAWLSWKEAK